MFTSRRSLLAGVGGVSLGAAVSALQPRQASASEAPLPVAAEGGEELVAVAVNDALGGAYGRHEGKRRNHTKGFGAVGHFVGTKEAAELSRSGLFAGDRIEVIGRVLTARGDPSASDSERSPRGLGLEFRLKGGALHHMTMIGRRRATSDQQREAIALRKAGEASTAIARTFGVSHLSAGSDRQRVADTERISKRTPYWHRPPAY